MHDLKEATTKEEFEIAKQLFEAYAKELKLDLSFQNFSQELKEIDLQYTKPQGGLFIAYDKNEKPVGCFGVREINDSICELKRMFIKMEYRGRGLGRAMMRKAIENAMYLGYQKMRLDTLASMKEAIGLYMSFGFYEIPAYRYNPIEGARYFEIDLE